MSNRRKMTPLVDALAGEDGERTPGGCDQCDALQEVAVAGSHALLIRVYHDQWCPVLDVTCHYCGWPLDSIAHELRCNREAA